jgi:hypothetical protein
MLFWKLVTHLVEVSLLQRNNDCKATSGKGSIAPLAKTSTEEILPSLFSRMEKTSTLDETSIPFGSRLLHLQVLRALKKHADGCSYFEKQMVPVLAPAGAIKGPYGNSVELATVGLAALDLYFESCFECALQSSSANDVKTVEKALQVAEDRAGLLLMSHSSALSQVLRPAFPVDLETSVYDELLQRLKQKHIAYRESAKDLVRSPISLPPSTPLRTAAPIQTSTVAPSVENRSENNAATVAPAVNSRDHGRSVPSSLLETIGTWLQQNIPGGLPVATGLIVAILLTVLYLVKGRVLRPRLAATAGPTRRPPAPRQLTF